jgi:hypothetical protein
VRRAQRIEIAGWVDGEGCDARWRALQSAFSLLGWSLAVMLIPSASVSFGGSRFAPQMIVAPVLAIVGLRRLPFRDTTPTLERQRAVLLVLAVVVLMASLGALCPPVSGVAMAVGGLAVTTYLVLLCAMVSHLVGFLGAPELRSGWQRLTKVMLGFLALGVSALVTVVVLTSAGVVTSTTVHIGSDTAPAVTVLLTVGAIAALGACIAVLMLLAITWSGTSGWIRDRGTEAAAIRRPSLLREDASRSTP